MSCTEYSHPYWENYAASSVWERIDFCRKDSLGYTEEVDRASSTFERVDIVSEQQKRVQNRQSSSFVPLERAWDVY